MRRLCLFGECFFLKLLKLCSESLIKTSVFPYVTFTQKCGQYPLYGLDRLAENKPVLIVEGEKAADAAQKLLPNHAVLSWAGGVGAVNKADWSPLVGRDVTIWPDHDVPGFIAAEKIENKLNQLNHEQEAKCTVKTVELPKDLPLKWDLADKLPETLTVDKIEKLITNNDPSIEISASRVEQGLNISSLEIKDVSKAILQQIQNIIKKNPQYDSAVDITDRVYKTYADIREIISQGGDLSTAADLHLLKQCVYATGEALNVREGNQFMAHPLEVRCTAEKHSWIEAITMEKTNSLEIEIPYRTAQEKTTLYRKWDNIVDKKIYNAAHAYPGIDATLNLTLGQEAIRLINLMPDYRNQIQSFIEQKISDVYSNQQKIIEASTILVSSNAEVKELKDNTVAFAKTLLVKEIIRNPGKEAASSISPLLEKVSREMRQEPHRIDLLHERNQQQHLQRNQQLSL